jgi:NitT/TauT family transport system substrate-binding protein
MNKINRRQFIRYSSIALSTSIVAACSNSNTQTNSNNSSTGKLDKITYGTNWYAQAEHGGFYQAIATGIYEQNGLDVTIQMGGPQVNGTQLLMGNAIDFFMGTGSESIKAVEEGIVRLVS